MTDEEEDTDVPITVEETDDDDGSATERLEAHAERAIDGFDQGVVDLLAWLLDTETRARLYVFLRQSGASTSEEVADGTGIYPSTVREALAELHDDGIVTREKRTTEGEGNNPYEYRAIPPSELMSGMLDRLQSELNELLSLGEDPRSNEDPITIEIDTNEDETEE